MAIGLFNSFVAFPSSSRLFSFPAFFSFSPYRFLSPKSLSSTLSLFLPPFLPLRPPCPSISLLLPRYSIQLFLENSRYCLQIPYSTYMDIRMCCSCSCRQLETHDYGLQRRFLKIQTLRKLIKTRRRHRTNKHRRCLNTYPPAHTHTLTVASNQRTAAIRPYSIGTFHNSAPTGSATKQTMACSARYSKSGEPTRTSIHHHSARPTPLLVPVQAVRNLKLETD